MAVPADITTYYTEKYGESFPERLDDIMVLTEPFKSVATDHFLQTTDPEHGSDVILRAHDKKPMQVTLGKRVFNIAPKGRRVSRRDAVALVQGYGVNGTYYGTDQATGLAEAAWKSMTPKLREAYDSADLKFISSYLTHIPDKPGAPESDFEDAAPAIIP